MFKIAFQQVFDNFNVNFHKKEGFLTSIPCVPIPEYRQSNAPLITVTFPYKDKPRERHLFNSFFTLSKFSRTFFFLKKFLIIRVKDS